MKELIVPYSMMALGIITVILSLIRLRKEFKDSSNPKFKKNLKWKLAFGTIIVVVIIIFLTNYSVSKY